MIDIKIMKLYNNDNLTIIDLSFNQINKITTNFPSLPLLNTLNLSNNKLKSIPNTFTTLISLNNINLSVYTYIIIQNNIFYDFPLVLINLKLRNLNISYNNISVIPQSIILLTTLKSLQLQYNSIKNLPESFKLLTELQEINLSRNNISNLPSSFNSLCNLTNLKCSYNFIKKINDINNLIELKEIDLSHNMYKILLLNSIDDITSFQFYKNLKRCNLSYNHITNISPIFELPNIETILLDHNNITFIPSIECKITRCTTLNLSNNNIEEIPLIFSNLTQLSLLDLSNNPNMKEPYNTILKTGELPYTENQGWKSIQEKLYFGCMSNSKILDKTLHELVNSENIPNSTLPVEQCVYRLLLYNTVKNKKGISKSGVQRVFILADINLSNKELEQISMKFPSEDNDIDIDKFTYAIFHKEYDGMLLPIIEYCIYKKMKKTITKGYEEIDFIVY